MIWANLLIDWAIREQTETGYKRWIGLRNQRSQVRILSGVPFISLIPFMLEESTLLDLFADFLLCVNLCVNFQLLVPG